MEWNNKSILKLIDLYREQNCLWDPANSDYKNKSKRLEAWTEISHLIGTNMDDVKRKMESLLTSFRRERQREDNKNMNGADKIYKSTWFAYNSMAFLLDKFAGKNLVNTGVSWYFYLNIVSFIYCKYDYCFNQKSILSQPDAMPNVSERKRKRPNQNLP